MDNLKQTVIYGVTGKKTHGKDTFSNLICKHNSDFNILHFADELKEICHKVYGLSPESMSDSFLKEKLFDKPIIMDDYVVSLSNVTGININKQNKIANSPREVLQFCGTDYVRSVVDTYWLDKLVEKIKPGTKNIISDVRFVNESQMLKSIGGRIIKIIRVDKVPSNDQHVSELEIDKIEEDLCVGAITGNLTLPDRCAMLLSKNVFNLKRFDYRYIMQAINAYKSGKSLEYAAKYLDTNNVAQLKLAMLYYGVKVINK